MRSGVNGIGDERRSAERAERIVDRIHDAGRRAGGASLARPFGAQFKVGGRRDHMADLDVGHFDRHRHQANAGFHMRVAGDQQVSDAMASREVATEAAELIVLQFLNSDEG